jgi:hypothetical protein
MKYTDCDTYDFLLDFNYPLEYGKQADEFKYIQEQNGVDVKMTAYAINELIVKEFRKTCYLYYLPVALDERFQTLVGEYLDYARNFETDGNPSYLVQADSCKFQKIVSYGFGELDEKEVSGTAVFSFQCHVAVLVSAFEDPIVNEVFDFEVSFLI